MNAVDAINEFDAEVLTVEIPRQTLAECAAEWAANWGQDSCEKNVDETDETR